MVDETLQLMKETDWFTAADYLNQQADTFTVLESYNELIKHLYYQEKNIPAMVAMARAGINYGLTALGALDDEDAESAWQLRKRIRALSYNLASFTWPGWDDPGISISDDSQAHGLDGGNLTLRLTQALQLGALKQSRSHWILGAQLLACGRHADAAKSFEQAITLAEEAKSEADVLLNQGYLVISELLSQASEQVDESELSEIKTRLVLLEDGEFFASQLATAWQVFAKRAKKG